FFLYIASLAPWFACANEDWVDDFSVIAVDPARVINEALAFTGSRENAEALVDGLRAGSETVLRERDSTRVHFQPPTGPLGYGNVSIAMSLAQTSLSVQGVVEPSAQQVAAALVGGEIFLDGQSIPIEGALALRAQGLSWGEVAEALGFTLGDAVSVAGAENPDQRRALAQRRTQREVEIVERSISALPELRIVGPDRVRRNFK
ncbi:MAG: hypothetical protein ACREUQ_01475, partial [Burkholderiales bacterium]